MGYARGEIVWAKLHNNRGTETSGRRPVLIVSSEIHNTLYHGRIVVPLTKQTKNAAWTGHVLMKLKIPPTNITTVSVAMCEHVTEVSEEFLEDKIADCPVGEFLKVIETLKNIIL